MYFATLDRFMLWLRKHLRNGREILNPRATLTTRPPQLMVTPKGETLNVFYYCKNDSVTLSN